MLQDVTLLPFMSTLKFTIHSSPSSEPCSIQYIRNSGERVIRSDLEVVKVMSALDRLHWKLASGKRNECSGVTHSSQWLIYLADVSLILESGIVPISNSIQAIDCRHMKSRCAFQHIDNLAWPQLNSSFALYLVIHCTATQGLSLRVQVWAVWLSSENCFACICI